MPRVGSAKDMVIGGIFILFAIVVLWMSSKYSMGTARHMGPGYMPRALGWILLGLGCIIAIKGVAFKGDDMPSFDWRSLGLITGSVVAFALSLPYLGLVLSSVLLVLIAAPASPGQRVIELGAISAILIAALSAIFVWGLSVPVALFPSVF